MTVLQNKKVRAGVGIAAVLLAAAGIGAGTYAAFSDTETGPTGTVESGTLDLVASGGGGSLELFRATNIKPGFSQTATFVLRNDGSLPGTLSSRLTVTGRDVTCTEPEAEAEGRALGACNPAGDLQNQLMVSVTKGPGAVTPPVTVAQFQTNGLPTGGGTLAAGATTEYELQFTLPDLPGTENNKVQGDSIVLSSTFNIVQL